MTWYLSHITPYPFYEEQPDLLLSGGVPQVTRFPPEEPLLALYEQYGMSQQEHTFLKHVPWELKARLVPVSRAESAAHMGTEALRALLDRAPKAREKCRYLVYGHETTEPNFYLTPCLYVKKTLKLKRLLPFALSRCGSCTLPGALELVKTLHPSAPGQAAAESLFVTADRLCPPHPRYWFDADPKGDAAAACLVSTVGGDWAVVDAVADGWPLASDDPYRWSEADYRRHERRLLAGCRQAVSVLLRRNAADAGRIVLAVPQTLSSTFRRYVEKLLPYPVYRRTYAAGCNLLGSDCLLSLKEAEDGHLFQPGDCVLLLQAGPLSHLGLLLLRKTNKYGETNGGYAK